MHTPGDTAAANDTLTRGILVRPYNDIAVYGEVDLTRLMAGETREASFVVRTGRRALSSARFVARHYLPGIRVAAIRATIGDCQVDASAGAACEFSNLAADSELTVTVGWRAEEAAEADVVRRRDHRRRCRHGQQHRARPRRGHGCRRTWSCAWQRLQTATAGATFDFPAISVVNGAEKAFGTRLEVTLPAEVTLVSLSASNAICSGTAVLRCDFDEIDAHGTATVNLTVRAMPARHTHELPQAHVGERHQPGQRQPRSGGRDFRQLGNRRREQRRRRWWILRMAQPRAARPDLRSDGAGPANRYDSGQSMSRPLTWARERC